MSLVAMPTGWPYSMISCPAAMSVRASLWPSGTASVSRTLIEAGPAQVAPVRGTRIDIPHRDADQVAVPVGQEVRCARPLRHVLLPGLGGVATGLGG